MNNIFTMEILRAKWFFDGERLLNDVSFALENNIIVDLDNIVFLKKKYPYANITDYGEGVLFSGFVNAHMHLELSNIKIEPYLGFLDWLKSIIKIKQSANTNDLDVQNSIIAAIDNQKKSGVCAIADVSNTLISSKYLNHFPCSILFFENYSLNRDTAFEKINFIDNNLSNLRKKHAQKIFVSPHSIYSTHKALLAYTMQKENPKAKDDLFSIHFLESEFENPFAYSGGELYKILSDMGLIEEKLNYLSALDYIKSLGDIKKGLFVHCVHAKKDEVDYLKSIDASIVICPRSNYYISKQLPPLSLFKKANINVAIGTDSLASNWDLNFIDELKFLRKNFTLIEPSYFFKIATAGGYRALNLNIGFKKGAKCFPFFLRATTNDPLEEILH